MESLVDHRIWVFSELHLRLPSIFLECMSKSFLTNRPTNRPTDWFVQSRARGCKNWLHFLTAGQLDCAPSNAFFGDKATCNSYVSKDTVSQQYKKGLWFQWRANLKVNVVRFGFKNQPCGGDCVAQSPKRWGTGNWKTKPKKLGVAISSQTGRQGRTTARLTHLLTFWPMGGQSFF